MKFSLVFCSWLLFKKVFSTKNDRWWIQVLIFKNRLTAELFHRFKTVSSVLRKNWWKVVLCQQDLYVSEFLLITVTHFSRWFFRMVKRSSVHRLQLGFVHVFIAPIGFIWFTALNVAYLRRSVRDVVALRFCSKRAANESNFCPLLIRYRISDK